jgi:hypothetical protein
MDTNGIETTTWFDQKPTHPPVSKAVLVAIENAADTQAEYDATIEHYLHAEPEMNWPNIEYMAQLANDADRELLLARDIALNCKHENTSMTGTMTFNAGEVDDNFVTVCEDCGRRVGGE